MSAADVDSLFRELKPDVERLANPLFDASRYMPFRKRMLPGYRFGQIVVQPASAEINSWGDPAGA